MTDKTTLGIIFGGRSVEHEVSILSGHQALSAVDPDRYNIQPIYLDQDNIWYIGDKIRDLDFFRQTIIPINELTQVYASPDPRNGTLRLVEAEPGRFRKAEVVEINCVLPVTHGTFVEDGGLQGMLDMSGIPYVGSNVRASAIGADKALFKSVLKAERLPYLPYVTVSKLEWETDPEDVIHFITDILKTPLFIKPTSLGSSIGISRTDSTDGTTKALDLAFRYGEYALVEKALDDAIEINCSVIDGDPPVPSVLEQPFSSSSLLTFDEKYKGNGKKLSSENKGMAAQKRVIPAPLSKDLTERIQALAARTFKTAGASGVARIDFLISKEHDIYINELNTIPGSLSFYLWEHMGHSFTELIDKLIDRAHEIYRRKNRMTFSFDANLLAED